MAPTRENPYLAPLMEKRALTRDVSSKLTLHMSFDIAGSEIVYEAGDSCGVVAENHPALVAEILDRMSLNGDEPVQLARIGTVTVHDALTHHMQITKLTRKMVETYGKKGEIHKLLGLLVPEQQMHLDDYTYTRGLIDLLVEYPKVMTTADELVAMLPKLTPRLYSIASSPAAHAGEIHTTIAVVRYRTHDRERGGVATTMLADRSEVGQKLPIYIQPNKKFRLPQDPDAKVIMVGPGTGVAPFRSFLHERRTLGAKGKNWLFFGERSAATDFLYKEEFEEMVKDGSLTRLDTAFSRDQEHKIYVQDRMLEQAAQLWAWLEEGASFYVCGDANRMAKDVDAALLSIIGKQGGLDLEGAKAYVTAMKDHHRYHKDVY